MKYLRLLLILLTGFQIPAAEVVQMIAPDLIKEFTSDEREYQDCLIQGSQFVCPTDSPEGYTCQNAVTDDFFSDSEQISNIRRYILGHTEASLEDLEEGRDAGAECVSERNFASPFGPKPRMQHVQQIQIYNELEQVVATIPRTTNTPQIGTTGISFNPSQSISPLLSFGCKSNICKKITSIPQTSNYNQYRCQPRKVCRCMEDGEAASSAAQCCEPLVFTGGKCVYPPNPYQDSLEGLPKNVDDKVGIFEIKSPAREALHLDNIKLKALEWLAFAQQPEERCLPEGEAMKSLIGNKLSTLMVNATKQYNKDLEKLQKLKDQFIAYAGQIKDPLKYYEQQGSITYRGLNLTAEQFQSFVQGSTSGAEMMNLMADEQAIQLKYEDTVRRGLDEITANLSIMQNQFQDFAGNSNGKGIDKAFGMDFGCRRTGFLGFKRKLKNRWRAQYRMKRGTKDYNDLKNNYDADPENRTLQNMVMHAIMGPVGYLFWRRPTIYFTEPIIASGMSSDAKKYENYGEKAQTLGDWLRGQKARKINNDHPLSEIKDHFTKAINHYTKTKYFDQGFDIIDVALGGFKFCVDSSSDVPFQVKPGEVCERYKTGVDLLHTTAYLMFIEGSLGTLRYSSTTFNNKVNFYRNTKASLVELQAMYYHLSAIPDHLGGNISYLTQNIDHKKVFDDLQASHPGFLRLKSYLFYKARAKELAGDINENGLSPGNGDYDLAGLYGTPAELIETPTLQTGDEQSLNTQGLTLGGAKRVSGKAANSSVATLGSSNSSGSYASANASGNPYRKQLAQINKASDDFLKKHPDAKKQLAAMNEEYSKAKGKLLASIAPSASGSPGMSSLSGAPAPTLSKIDENTQEEEKTLSASDAIGSKGADSQLTSSGYSEKGSRSGSGQNPTSLSDYELGKAVQNVEDQPHLFKPQDDDTIFRRVSKTYARSYSRFLERKEKSATLTSPEEVPKAKKASPKVQNLLDEF